MRWAAVLYIECDAKLSGPISWEKNAHRIMSIYFVYFSAKRARKAQSAPAKSKFAEPYNQKLDITIIFATVSI